MAGRPISDRHWQTVDGAILPYAPDRSGVPRILAALKPRPNFGALPRWRLNKPMVPRSQWEERDYSGFAAKILDQGDTSSCVGHGAATAFGRAYQMAGHDPVDFSPCYVYGKINGGTDEGAIVSDALNLLIKSGICREETVPEGMIYSKDFPPAADSEAAHYRVADAYHVGSFDELMSALMYGFIIVDGTFVTDEYVLGDLDAGGVPPVDGHGGGGHAQECHGITFIKAGPFKGRPAARTQGSWGVGWADGGMAYRVEEHFTYRMELFGGLDAFAIRATIDDPDDPNNPPSAPA